MFQGLVAVALSVAIALPAWAAPGPAAPPPRVQLVVEVVSYGERSRDLLSLLVPFFSKNLYSHALPLPRERRTDASAAFEHPSGDFVVTSGRFNCIVVVYYSARPGPDANGRIAKERAGLFQLALMDFLEELPEPRPRPREVTFGSRYCMTAA
jgi:hypothetical protein